MHNRIAVSLALIALLVFGPASAIASDAQFNQPSGIQLAQFGDMKGAGAASDADGFADFDEYDAVTIADPLEGWNKFWFYFNDGVYHGFFKPVAQGYAWAVPEKPRQWVRNFFTNLLYPVRFVNNMLQGKFDAAYMETSKFLANTAFGLGGLGDVTADMPRNWSPERPTADGFGQTLGKAGMGHGVYLVWPFLGPSSLRETAGKVGDHFLDPLTYADLTLAETIAIKAYTNVNKLSLELQSNEYETITEGAIDKYAAVRDAYIRFRAKKVQE